MVTFKDELDRTFRIPSTMMRIIGSAPNKNGEFNLRLMYAIWVTMVYSFLFLMYGMYLEWPDLTNVAIYACPCVGTISAYFRHLNLMYHRYDIRTLLKTITEDFWDDIKEDDEKEIISKYAHLAKKIMIFQIMITGLAAQLWIVKPFAEMFILAPEDPTKPVGRVFPFKNFAPFNIDIYATPIYQIVFLLQTFAIYFTMCVFITVDILFIFIVINTTGQLKLLQARIQKFHKQGSIRNQEYYFNECVKGHITLCRFYENIEKCYTKVLFTLLVFGVAFVCSCCFVITELRDNTYIYGHNLITFITGLTEMFFYSYVADEFTYEGIEVAYSAFASNWFEASKSIKSSILIVIIRAQRPMYLTAIKFAPISCATFETILRTAFSYFTVLSSMREDANEN